MSHDPTEDLDRQLGQIRPALEAKYGEKDNFFYASDIRGQWDANYNPDLWEDFVGGERESGYVDSGKLEEEEIDYKLVDRLERLRLARAAVLGGNDDWADLLRRGPWLATSFSAITQAKFRDWVKKFPENASEALNAIWAGDDSSVAGRIPAFSRYDCSQQQR